MKNRLGKNYRSPAPYNGYPSPTPEQIKAMAEETARFEAHRQRIDEIIVHIDLGIADERDLMDAIRFSDEIAHVRAMIAYIKKKEK